MKNNIYLVILMFLVSCATFHGDNNEHSVKDEDKNETKSFPVSGTIFYSESYCGGARPTDEMYLEITRERPYAGKKMYLLKGNKNEENKSIYDSIVPDSEGNFKLDLPPGEYCLIQSIQRDKKVFAYCENTKDEIEADRKCMEDWWSACFYSFTVSDKPIENIKLNFYRPCFLPEGIPCLSYNGPMPP